MLHRNAGAICFSPAAAKRGKSPVTIFDNHPWVSKARKII
jgi:hypothetical protein